MEKTKDKSFDILTTDSIKREYLFHSENLVNDGYIVFPGFVDVHTHLREPGFLYKETINTGTMAAARGGYTDVCSMPNLSPCPDGMENLKLQLDLIEKSANVRVHPYGTITKGERGEELSDIEELSEFVVGFSDDGRGVQSKSMMRDAMTRIAAAGGIIAAHCEDNALLRGGYIHDGEYARAHSHAGICSESEWGPIKRDIELVRETGCKYHVCHISTKESVELIRQAKREGLDVTCETAPHYLTLDENDLIDDGRFKMNPPLRGREDREALIEGVCDGTIDMIATDHAPHSAEEKSRGLKGSLMGITGLECAFPILYTELVLGGVITIDRLVEMMTVKPAERFSIGRNEKTNFCVFDLNESYVIDSAEFASMGKSTPFTGRRVFGRCKTTVCDGRVAWIDDGFDIREILA